MPLVLRREGEVEPVIYAVQRLREHIQNAGFDISIDSALSANTLLLERRCSFALPRLRIPVFSCCYCKCLRRAKAIALTMMKISLLLTEEQFSFAVVSREVDSLAALHA